MSPRAIVLRILLCISLFLNGSGYAVAATQMHMAHLAATAVAASDAGTPPCHAHGSMQLAAAAKHAAMADCAPAHAPAAPDCCQSSHCACDCLQHATAHLTHLPMPAAMLERAPDMGAVSAGHAPPLLANLIRPPIA